MKLKITTAIPAMALMLCAAGTLSAQEMGPPKVLVINREYTKPGKGGELHEKSESAFVAAAKANKAPFHYLGMTSMTGPDRALFFSGYDSFTAWADENKEMDKIPALGPALDHAMVGDGDLLSETDTSVWTRDDEKSMNPGNLIGMRYMELTLFHIKPGHDAEWDEVVKMVKDAYKKGVPEANWVMFQEAYGSPGGGYLVIEPLKSIGEIDAHIASGPKFAAAIGRGWHEEAGFADGFLRGRRAIEPVPLRPEDEPSVARADCGRAGLLGPEACSCSGKEAGGC